jgi:hypothetical protein
MFRVSLKLNRWEGEVEEGIQIKKNACYKYLGTKSKDIAFYIWKTSKKEDYFLGR